MLSLSTARARSTTVNERSSSKAPASARDRFFGHPRCRFFGLDKDTRAGLIELIFDLASPYILDPFRGYLRLTYGGELMHIEKNVATLNRIAFALESFGSVEGALQLRRIALKLEREL